MNRFVPKEKMSKKAKKRLAAEKRTTWAFSPASKKVDSKKRYNRKRISRAGYDDGREVFLWAFFPFTPPSFDTPAAGPV